MDWQDIGVLVAMVGVMGGFVLTWRGQQQDKELSESSASRSEAAARLTADNTERVLKALEVIAAKDFTANISGGVAQLPPVRAKWSLVHHSGDGYRLENVGDATAYDVVVTAHRSMRTPMLSKAGQDLGPGEAMTFMAVRTLGTSDITITVTWLDEPAATERAVWRYPLPPRPRH